jgi:hypothetical protein
MMNYVNLKPNPYTLLLLLLLLLLLVLLKSPDLLTPQAPLTHSSKNVHTVQHAFCITLRRNFVLLTVHLDICV